MIASNAHIDSAQFVQTKVKEETEMDVPIKKIQNIMTEDLDMSYCKIKNVSLHVNSVKNLVLRQRFAIKLLGIT